MAKYREPPIDTVLRHLVRASEIAQKRRLVASVRDAVGFALEHGVVNVGRLRE